MKKLSIALSVAALTLFAACGDDSGNNSTNDGSVVAETLIDDRDGQTYRTVKIGDQVWMAENLNYRNLGPTADDDSSSFCYDNDLANCTKYGRLYTWEAAVGRECGFGGKDCGPGAGIVRGVCPEGWHLPSAAEWDVLLTAVGDFSTAGTKLKSVTGWNEYEGKSGNGEDVYSFSVLPAGIRSSGYDSEGSSAFFWSSTEKGAESAYNVDMHHNGGGVGRHYDSKHRAFSVRCLKD